ncbi:glycine/sarcosine/betaine reductase selenoprotein B family protein [Candidatus Poriferisocius sp.]|uniref:glycine/sarcosine/betaine reductase selenoprotein B family protein n=1 Tax=Candidatus Poriferisocius sp. TaxID=3101276 RepID=UPI003B593C3F
MTDQMMREFAAALPVPEFETTAWAPAPELSRATVAVVTSAALHRPDDEPFSARGDAGYRLLDREDRNLVLGHWSSNFDRSAFLLDLNVVYPVDRLEELAADGVIGEVAPRHVAFAGNQPDTVSEVRMDTGPAAAADLRADGVDVAILTPV